MQKLLENLRIGEYIDQYTVPPHPERTVKRSQESHAEREILLVIDGDMPFALSGKLHAAVKGTAFFIDSWIPHQLGYENIKNSTCHIWVHLHKKRLFAMPYILEHGSRLQSSGMWEFPDSMLELINLRWNQAKNAPANERSKYYSSIVRMIIEEISFQNSSTKNNSGKEEDIISWLKNYISMNYGRNSSMEELERLTGFNRRHLMRKFKNETTMTIGEYINCIRRGFTAAAGKRLTQKEIAFQLGFKSPAAFWLWQKRDRQKHSKG